MRNTRWFLLIPKVLVDRVILVRGKQVLSQIVEVCISWSTVIFRRGRKWKKSYCAHLPVYMQICTIVNCWGWLSFRIYDFDILICNHFMSYFRRNSSEIWIVCSSSYLTLISLMSLSFSLIGEFDVFFSLIG